MKLYEAKDIVREHFGRLKFPTTFLNHALTQGRRVVEKHGNFWWMRQTKDFSLVVNQPIYKIKTVSGSNALNLPNFKDARWLNWKEPTGVRYEPVSLGTLTKEELDLHYDTDDTGSPEAAIIENDELIIYPLLPDDTYGMRLYIYQWTDNPVSNLDSDDLLEFFPMALIYAALAWGYEMEVKDFSSANYWRLLLGGQPFGRGGELAKIKAENLKRDWQDQIDFTPRLGGAGLRTRRRLDNVQIYR